MYIKIQEYDTRVQFVDYLRPSLQSKEGGKGTGGR